MAKGAKARQTRLAMLSGLGLRRGLMGGSRFWMVVGGAAAGLRLVRRISGAAPEVVYSEELPAGQSILITNGDVTASGLDPR